MKDPKSRREVLRLLMLSGATAALQGCGVTTRNSSGNPDNMGFVSPTASGGTYQERDMRVIEWDYNGDAPAGTVMVSYAHEQLYIVQPGGNRVKVYTVGVPRYDQRANVRELGGRNAMDSGIQYVETRITAERPDPVWRPTADTIAAAREQGRELKSAYQPGEPGNALGAYAFTLRSPYLIHGTGDLYSLGSSATRGCIRMRNEDILDLAASGAMANGVSVRFYYDTIPGIQFSERMITRQRPVVSARDAFSSYRPR